MYRLHTELKGQGLIAQRNLSRSLNYSKISSRSDDMELPLWKMTPIFHYFQKLVGWDHSINEDKRCNRFGIKHLDVFLPLRMYTGNFNRAGGNAENFSATLLSSLFFYSFLLHIQSLVHFRSISESSIQISKNFLTSSIFVLWTQRKSNHLW